MTTQPRTMAAMLSELSYLPASDPQFATQRSHVLAELEHEYYAFRNAKERQGWYSEVGLDTVKVFDTGGKVVGIGKIDTHAWAQAQLSLYSL